MISYSKEHWIKRSKLRPFLPSPDVKVTTAKITHRTQSKTRGSNCFNASLHCERLALTSSIHMKDIESVYHMWKTEWHLWYAHSNCKLYYAVVLNLKGCSCNSADSKSVPILICSENVMLCIKLQPSNKTTLIMYQDGKIGLHMTNFLCLIWIYFMKKYYLH